LWLGSSILGGIDLRIRDCLLQSIIVLLLLLLLLLLAFFLWLLIEEYWPLQVMARSID
jgi:hypothetical protein